jgi:hypothetical protein
MIFKERNACWQPIAMRAGINKAITNADNPVRLII